MVTYKDTNGAEITITPKKFQQWKESGRLPPSALQADQKAPNSNLEENAVMENEWERKFQHQTLKELWEKAKYSQLPGDLDEKRRVLLEKLWEEARNASLPDDGWEYEDEPQTLEELWEEAQNSPLPEDDGEW